MQTSFTLCDKLLIICEFINELNLTPKQFMDGFLTFSEPSLAKRRSSIGSKASWPSTLEILFDFKRLICCAKDGGEERWVQFISEEAKKIVIEEDLPSGHAPEGMFYTPKTITHSFLEKESQDSRHEMVSENMPFLHDLIEAKLKHVQNLKLKEQVKRISKKKDPEEPAKGTKLEATNNMETSPLEKLPAIICSMVAFACNRRHCGLQMENGIKFFQGGVSQEIHHYLHSIGLTLSRKTAKEATDKLKHEADERIRKINISPPIKEADKL